MRQLRRYSPFTILILSVLVLAVEASEVSSDVIPYTRLYADSEGRTHFSDHEIELPSDNPHFNVSPFTPASSVGFFRAETTADMDWHPAPRRQWIFILAGTAELEVQDGEVRQFSRGSVIFVEDTTGKGHRSRTVGNVPVLAAWVPVDPN